MKVIAGARLDYSDSRSRRQHKTKDSHELDERKLPMGLGWGRGTVPVVLAERRARAQDRDFSANSDWPMPRAQAKPLGMWPDKGALLPAGPRRRVAQGLQGHREAAGCPQRPHPNPHQREVE